MASRASSPTDGGRPRLGVQVEAAVGATLDDWLDGAVETVRLAGWSEGRVADSDLLALDGAIVEDGASSGPEVLAAGAVPVAQVGSLSDAARLESFLDRLFTRFRIRTELAASPSRGSLVAFHTRHKLLYMAHSPAGYRELGRLVGTARDPIDAAIQRYTAAAMTALARPATRGTHTNALHHAFGMVSRGLSAEDRAELLALIDDYRHGRHPLSVPLARLRDHVRRHRHRPSAGYLAEQVYLSPYPPGLAAVTAEAGR